MFHEGCVDSLFFAGFINAKMENGWISQTPTGESGTCKNSEPTVAIRQCIQKWLAP